MTLEVDEPNKLIKVNGIYITFDLLEAITLPDETKLHRFIRRGNQVIITSHVSLTEYKPDGMVQ